MCGAHSALGLDEVERVAWPQLREQLRRPGEEVDGRRRGHIGDHEVDLVMADFEGGRLPAAVLMSPWIFENLTVYARKLWSRRPLPPKE